MPASASTLFRFGPFTLDAKRRELRRGDAPVPLRRQPLALLLYLVRHRDRTVSRNELRRSVWAGVHVSEQAIDTALHRLRAALEDESGGASYLTVERGLGVRFAAPVPEVEPVGAPEPDFLGRGPIIAAAARSLERVRAGSGRLLLLQGEPGMGKSRTLREISRRAHDFARATGFCEERSGSPPHWPWVEALSASSEAGMPGLDELAGLLSNGSARGRRARGSRVELFDEVQRLLRRASGERPLLIALEDLHWADEATLALLEYLVPRLPEARVVVIGTYRPVAEPASRPFVESLGRLVTLPGTEVLRLEPLGSNEVYGLVQVLRGFPPTAVQVSALLERTGGNPFFLREFIARLDAGGGSLDGLPFGVQAALARRVAALSPETQHALAHAALCGERFDPGWAEVAARERLDTERRWLREGLEHGVLVRDEGRGERVAFVHALLREALVATLDERDRRRAHRAVAELIEATHPDPGGEILSRLAHHFAAALPVEPDADRALGYALRAAEAAAEMHAFDEVAVHARRALEWISAFEPGRERDELELRVVLLACAAANARMRTQDPEAARLSARARALADRLHESGSAVRAALQSSIRDLYAGDLRDMEATLERIGGARDPDEQSAAAALTAARATFAGEFERADRAARRVETSSASSVGLAAVLGFDPVALGLPVAATARWALGDEAGALARLDASLEHARGCGAFASVYAFFHGCLLHDLRGDAEALEALAAQIDPLCATHAIGTFLGSGQMFSALAALHAGAGGSQPWEGMARVMRGLAAAPDSPRLGAFKLFTAARFEAARGERAAALRDAAAARARGARDGEDFLCAEILRFEARLLEPARARTALEQAVAVARAQGARALEARALGALAALRSGRDAEERELR